MEEIILNKYQTPITEEYLESLNPEVKDDLLDAITNIEFIKRLISPDRKYAKDLDRREVSIVTDITTNTRVIENRIIVDIVNPHILEDMEYFRPTGNHFRQHGTLTNLRPNANPSSEFGKWLRQEKLRIWYGMVRPSDGEWITGDMYFYLNYTPIIQSKIREGTKQADRVIDFPEVWEGIYLWFHYQDQARNGGIYNNWEGAEHAIQIARRGASKSYSAAARLAKLFICGENELACKSVKGAVTAYQKEYLTKDGILNKFIDIIDFNAEHTQFPSQRLKDSLADMSWMMGYKDADTNTNKGTGNEVLGISAKDNTDKSRGKRSNIFIYEEFGAFPKFIDTWGVNKSNVQEDDIVFGQAVGFGTGGSEGSDFSGALEMIYNPIGYGVYALPNVYDKNSQGKQKTVFFFGSYLNRKGCYNKDGVSDVILALTREFEARFKVKYNSSDSMALTRKKAEQAITIQEAVMKREGTIYPVADLTDRLNELDFNPKSYDDILVGLISLDKDAVVRFKPSSEVKPIREFPHKDNKLEGCIEIHALPVMDSNNKVYRGRYIAGIDPYDDDASGTLSLGSLYILDLYTDKIVFEYTGRPMFANDFYEICRRALLMYNAECNYENNKKGLFTYFSTHNCTYLLSDNLEFLKDKASTKVEANYGNKAKGTISSAPIKAYGRRAIKEWLLKPYTVTKVIDKEEVDVKVPFLTQLNSRALIKELILWNPDGNFDRHDALAMLMLIREDKLRLFGTNTPSESLGKERGSELADDPFFTNNYKPYKEDTFTKNYKALGLHLDNNQE
jgi:hypothetical protein